MCSILIHIKMIHNHNPPYLLVLSHPPPPPTLFHNGYDYHSESLFSPLFIRLHVYLTNAHLCRMHTQTSEHSFFLQLMLGCFCCCCFFWGGGGVYNKLRENIKLMQPVIAYFNTVIWKFEQQLGNKFHNNPKSNLTHTSPKSPPPPPYPIKKNFVDIYIVDNNSIYRLDLAAGKSSIRIISIFITNSHTVWLSQWLELENLCIEI